MPVSSTTLISEGFGTSDSGKTYPIPVPSQIAITPGAASFTDGFPPLTRTPLGSGGYPPSGEDINGILYMVTANLALVCSGQPYKWDSGQSSAIGGYGVGAVVQRTDGTGFWLNTTNGNTTNPDAGGAGWVPAWNYGTSNVTASAGNLTLTLANISKRVIVVSGTLTANAALVFPAGITGDWIIANDTSGAFALGAFLSGGGNTVSIPQAGANAPTIVYSDGTNLYNANVSTAGLAPIASPGLTGTPTTPTASPGSNTTQIASTAFVQAAITAAVASLAPLASPTFSGVPTVPTAAPGTNTLQAASTAFVQAALASGLQLRAGSFTCVNGNVSVAFATAFSTQCIAVVCQGEYTGVDVGNVFSRSNSGFQYHNGNSGPMTYIAVGN